MKHGQKRTSRTMRLQAAKQWIAEYPGKNLVRGYKKRFGVGDVCAVLELRMLGVDISDARLEQARRDQRSRPTRRARQKEKHARTTLFPDSDDEFAFIAGYTEGGAPFGIRWDEADEASDDERARRAAADVVRQAARLMDDDDDLPF